MYIKRQWAQLFKALHTNVDEIEVICLVTPLDLTCFVFDVKQNVTFCCSREISTDLSLD